MATFFPGLEKLAWLCCLSSKNEEVGCAKEKGSFASPKAIGKDR